MASGIDGRSRSRGIAVSLWAGSKIELRQDAINAVPHSPLELFDCLLPLFLSRRCYLPAQPSDFLQDQFPPRLEELRIALPVKGTRRRGFRG